ncbi:uncharacterized protein BP5553_09352 [Venustampulla echinocandica]|uniref:Uncharacterized protein n=1 Tax=Venustampulla echinocandica TaxID=2656787 RepID=A0A370TCG5_9HELO|nr:uncharacterized protein BP5553_09352 [Venustampulla echinocandica]RDL31950.1 hypothetical protein BP5553_09352 [Venustampulla echinocandica]
MRSISCNYLVPAILLNPAFILHLINALMSRFVLPGPHPPSHSPNPFMEMLGPAPGSTPYLDMHSDDQLCCYGYTAIMVMVQIFAFGRVQDNRVRKRGAKAATSEREARRKEKLDILQEDGVEASTKTNGVIRRSDGATNGNGKCDIARTSTLSNGGVEASDDLETEESMTETSEEEMML